MFERHTAAARLGNILILCAVIGLVLAVVSAVVPVVLDAVDQAGAASGR